MKAKFISTVILLLVIGLLKSDATYEGYSITITPNDPDEDYYNPEVYLADTYDAESDYAEPMDAPKHDQMDELYGAFKIITKPKGADINLYDADMYLSETPTPVYPVIMDESMELREGIPGRTITLMITKEGYRPMKKDIFVPFLYQNQERALKHPTVFKFNLKRDYDRSNVSISFYYSYSNRHHRYRHHHHWFGPPSYFPWCPPGYIGWYYPPLPPYYQGPHYGLGYWTPYPPPPPHHGDGHHHQGGQNPPNGPWDGGIGSNGDYPPHHNMPIPPTVGSGNSNSQSGSSANVKPVITPIGHSNTASVKPVITPVGHNDTQVVHARPDLGTKPHADTDGSNISSSSGISGKPQVIKPYTPPKPKPKPASNSNNNSYQKPLKPQPDNEKPRPSYQEQPKPRPQQGKPQPSYTEKPQPKPTNEKPRPSYQQKPKPKPDKEQNLTKPKPQAREKDTQAKPKSNSKPKSDDDDNSKEDTGKKLLKYVKA